MNITAINGFSLHNIEKVSFGNREMSYEQFCDIADNYDLLEAMNTAGLINKNAFQTFNKKLSKMKSPASKTVKEQLLLAQQKRMTYHFSELFKNIRNGEYFYEATFTPDDMQLVTVKNGKKLIHKDVFIEIEDTVNQHHLDYILAHGAEQELQQLIDFRDKNPQLFDEDTHADIINKIKAIATKDVIINNQEQAETNSSVRTAVSDIKAWNFAEYYDATIIAMAKRLKL